MTDSCGAAYQRCYRCGLEFGCRSIGREWWLVGIIPTWDSLYLLWLNAQPSDPDDNRFRPLPASAPRAAIAN